MNSKFFEVTQDAYVKVSEITAFHKQSIDTIAIAISERDGFYRYLFESQKERDVSYERLKKAVGASKGAQ